MKARTLISFCQRAPLEPFPRRIGCGVPGWLRCGRTHVKLQWRRASRTRPEMPSRLAFCPNASVSRIEKELLETQDAPTQKGKSYASQIGGDLRKSLNFSGSRRRRPGRRAEFRRSPPKIPQRHVDQSELWLGWMQETDCRMSAPGRRAGAEMHIEQRFGVMSDQPLTWKIRVLRHPARSILVDRRPLNRRRQDVAGEASDDRRSPESDRPARSDRSHRRKAARLLRARGARLLNCC